MIILPGTPIYMFVVFNSLHHKMHVIKWSKCKRALSAYLFNSTYNSFAPTLLRPQSSRLFRTLRSRVYGMVIFLGNLNLCSICPLQYLPFAVFVLGSIRPWQYLSIAVFGLAVFVHCSICPLQYLHLSSICPLQYLSFAVFVLCSICPLQYLHLSSICPWQYLSFAVFVLGSICPLQYLSLAVFVLISICPLQYLGFVQ